MELQAERFAKLRSTGKPGILIKKVYPSRETVQLMIRGVDFGTQKLQGAGQ